MVILYHEYLTAKAVEAPCYSTEGREIHKENAYMNKENAYMNLLACLLAY